jgi:hypothetical protein
MLSCISKQMASKYEQMSENNCTIPKAEYWFLIYKTINFILFCRALNTVVLIWYTDRLAFIQPLQAKIVKD